MSYSAHLDNQTLEELAQKLEAVRYMIDLREIPDPGAKKPHEQKMPMRRLREEERREYIVNEFQKLAILIAQKVYGLPIPDDPELLPNFMEWRTSTVLAETPEP